MAVAGEVVKKLVKPKRGPRKGSLSKADIKKHMEFMADIKTMGWGVFYNGRS
jgi:hypothetical protein